MVGCTTDHLNLPSHVEAPKHPSSHQKQTKHSGVTEVLKHPSSHQGWAGYSGASCGFDLHLPAA